MEDVKDDRLLGIGEDRVVHVGDIVATAAFGLDSLVSRHYCAVCDKGAFAEQSDLAWREGGGGRLVGVLRSHDEDQSEHAQQRIEPEQPAYKLEEGQVGLAIGFFRKGSRLSRNPKNGQKYKKQKLRSIFLSEPCHSMNPLSTFFTSFNSDLSFLSFSFSLR